ncbi:uncharacterized protein LOC117320207 [Pecten maximus]|uniref:uncharacterized protein LOC117320207 n=1 Tax=Pecten maximus TaxID=6579 RepID=UPI0014586198|nr:uncharacterized protein LOC117320207 [Pecten maximus]
MSFNVGNPDDIFGLDIEQNHYKPIGDTELDAILSFFGSASDDISPQKANREMNETLEDCQLSMPTPYTQPKRFPELHESSLQEIEKNRQAKATKKNTKWGLKVFQAWSTERYGEEIDFGTIDTGNLNDKLRVFYAEATPKNPEKREKEMTSDQAREYHKNSMKSIRGALNRHIKDVGRDMDIVRDKDFRSANNMLDGKLKQNIVEGKSRPTQHKTIIENDDLIKIGTYLHQNVNPVILRLRVWYDLSIHFVSRGLEFHSQLTPESFTFHTDADSTEYVTLSHETKQKNRQGGLTSIDASSDKRMYATGNIRCPVQSLKLFLRKTPSDAKHLFNHCDKDAMNHPESFECWYTKTPVKQYQFARFMADISKNAICSNTYTAHCLRATSISKLSEADVELRHIMYYSGHRNESSIRSYSRDCSANQKRVISNTLASLTNQNCDHNQNGVGPLAAAEKYNLPLIPSNSLPMTYASSSSNVLSSGLFSNSSFNNCVFNFPH